MSSQFEIVCQRNSGRSYPQRLALIQFSCIIAIFVLSCLCQQFAHSQSSVARKETWITNGTVRSIIGTTSKIYIGGDFSYVGPVTGCGVPMDAATGAKPAQFPMVNGPVLASAPDGNGGWYIGGSFTQVGNDKRNSIAHVFSDGTLDQGWDPNATGNNPYISVIQLAGSKLFVAGFFSSIGGKERSQIAALNAATGLATDFNTVVEGQYGAGSIYAMQVLDSTVFVGGDFARIGGYDRANLAALDAETGAVSSWKADAYMAVYALALSGQTLYVGGHFWSIGDKQYAFLAAVDAWNGTVLDWNPAPNGRELYVYSLAVSGNTLYVGGGFSTIAGQTRNAIAAFDTTTNQITPWDPSAGGIGLPRIQALAASGSVIYAGGEFKNIGGKDRNSIAALNMDTDLATDWDPNTSDNVNTISISGSKVYVGGAFSSMGGVNRKLLASLDAKTGMATDWDPQMNGRSNALAISGSTVYVAGFFSKVGEQNRYNIASFDEFTGELDSWSPEVNGEIFALAVADSTAYIGGRFTTVGGKPRRGLAAIDTETGEIKDWNPNLTGSVDPMVATILTSGSLIYVGGGFSAVGGKTKNHIAAIDTSTGLATDWNPNSNSIVRCLALSGSTLYAGGSFTSIGGKTRNAAAALDTSTGLATEWDPNVTGGYYNICSLAHWGSSVLAGGDFRKAGGEDRLSLAAFDMSTALPTRWNPIAENNRYTATIYALFSTDSTVYAGGEFFTIGGLPRSNFAEFPIPPLVARGWQLFE